jgi:hypothetical protein
VVVAFYEWTSKVYAETIQQDQYNIFKKINYSLPYEPDEFEKHKKINGVKEGVPKEFNHSQALTNA